MSVVPTQLTITTVPPSRAPSGRHRVVAVIGDNGRIPVATSTTTKGSTRPEINEIVGSQRAIISASANRGAGGRADRTMSSGAFTVERYAPGRPVDSVVAVGRPSRGFIIDERRSPAFFYRAAHLAGSSWPYRPLSAGTLGGRTTA